MVPRKNRLPREAFRARGYRTVKTPFFFVKTKENDAGVNRIAVVVGTSVDKRAVRRNFLERQAKTQLLQVANFKPNSPKDIIVTIFPSAAKLTKRQLTAEIAEILKIAKL